MKNKSLKVLLAGMAVAVAAGTFFPASVMAAPAGEWKEENGAFYWYENGVKQGYDATNPNYRGKEIYDEASDAWYWLDNVEGGAKAVNKDVYQESEAGIWGDRVGEDGLRYGKWVRYDENGHMIKGWSADGNYYFDPIYGTMAKGYATIDGIEYYFNPNNGLLECKIGAVPENGWMTIDGQDFWYENYVRQGYSVDGSYRGKEIFDEDSNAWYWLDSVQGGAKAISKDVYQESQADDAGNIGKWVRYDENGHMIKGWSSDNMYYFDPVYGTMAKGTLIIDGTKYVFDENTGEKLSVDENKIGLDVYGIECNVTENERYYYKTISDATNKMETTGVATFFCDTFDPNSLYAPYRPSDEHIEREGYVWKHFGADISFSDEIAQNYGISWAWMWTDYYTFNNSPLSITDNDVVLKPTILYNGKEYEIEIEQYNYWEWMDETGYVYLGYYCYVPEGYDGLTLILYNAANVSNGDAPLERMDDDTLVFRMD